MQSRDNPASAHTTHRPVETSLHAANTSTKKKAMDLALKTTNMKVQQVPELYLHLPLWNPRANWARCEADSRSGGPCWQPACPGHPLLWGHTAPWEPRRSAARALRRWKVGKTFCWEPRGIDTIFIDDAAAQRETGLKGRWHAFRFYILANCKTRLASKW